MTIDEVISFIGTAAASGVIGNKMDRVLVSLDPVRKLHEWFKARLIDPALVEPGHTTESWVAQLGDADREQLISLLRDAAGAAEARTVSSSSGVAIGGSVNGGTIIGTLHHSANSSPDGGWEYAKVDCAQEADFYNNSQMKWVAYITWPGAEGLDVRDHVRAERILNEMGKDGWELVNQQPNKGINGTDYFLRRPRRQ